MQFTYWEENGQEQEKYNTMCNAVQAGAYTFSKAAENQFRQYYRYYNDGDIPGWARSRYDLTVMRFYKCYSQKELNEAGMKELEDRTTERILAEYKRFLKAIKEA